MSTQTTRSGGTAGRTKKAAGGADTTHSAKKQQSSAADTQKQNHNTESHKDNKENVPKPHLKQATPEQTRMAQLIGNGLSSTDDGKMQEKVASLMETTQRSEEDVCFALYECDNDLDRAVIYLLEQLPEGAFEKSGKKKKNRAQAGATNNGAADDDWNDNAMPARRGDDRSRTRGGLRNNTGGPGAPGGRPGEGPRGAGFRKDGDGKFGAGRGLDNRGGDRRGDRGGDGLGRGGRGGSFGGRGGRGGRMGPRGLGSRDQQGGTGGRSGYGRGGYDNGGGGPVEAMDNWDNSQANLPPAGQSEMKTDDSWGDWDNEEYTGSLADTKVFTPSTAGGPADVVTAASIVAGGGGGDADGAAVTTTSASGASKTPNYSQVCSGAVSGSGAPSVAAVVSGQQQQQQQPPAAQQVTSATASGTQFTDLASTTAHRQNLADMPSAAAGTTTVGASSSAGGATTTLSAEQSQYFNSLTSQNSSQQQAAAQASAYQAAGVQYPSSYGGAAAGYGDATGTQGAAQQQRKPLPRAKVPPPSKIPASAVEMPGDMGGYLDVQFGLDFGSEESFDQLSDRFGAATIEAAAGNATAGQPTVVDQQDAYQQQQQQAKATGASTGLSDQLSGYAGASGQRPGVATQASVQATNTGAPAGYQSQYGAQTAAVQTTGQGAVTGAGQGSSATANKAGRSPYANQAPGVTNNSFASNVAGTGGYQNQAQYSQQTQQQQQQQYGGYNQSTGGYNQSNVAVNSNQVSSQVQAVVNNAAAAAQTAGQVVNSRYGTSSSSAGGVGNSSSSGGGGSGTSVTGSGAGAGGMSSVSNSGTGTNGVVGTGSGSTSVASSVAAQFGNSFGGASTASKLAAVVAAQQNSSNNNNQTPISSTAFDSVASNVAANNVAGQGTASAISNNAVSTNNTANMNSPSSLGLVNNNTSKVSNATTKSSVVSNIPIMNQYIQASVPFYQPPVYSYEELQILQQRLPHMQTGYYDINQYQTQSGLGAAGVRDGTYSAMTSDGRFARTDNNSSPVSNVPSTMSQQQAQAGSGGPMLNLPYAYFYGGNMMPGFQYGTPVYPQQMATTNATSGGQFAKPNAYNSGYGSSAYDSLNQSAQDYGKSSGYQSGGVGQQQSKGQSVNNQQQSGSGSDISSSMYGKSHVALNKVNSYEKQSFHSGTPPPFGMAGSQTTGQTSQPYGMYISTMPAPHHNMNMHQPMHQDSSSSGGQRQQSNSQGKAGTKQGYSPSYWAAQN